MQADYYLRCYRPQQSNLVEVNLLHPLPLCRRAHTLRKLSNEMLGDGLQLGLVYGEHLLESLDFLQKVLWHIGHGTWVMLAGCQGARGRS
jgi:hypothetical protein